MRKGPAETRRGSGCCGHCRMGFSAGAVLSQGVVSRCGHVRFRVGPSHVTTRWMTSWTEQSFTKKITVYTVN